MRKIVLVMTAFMLPWGLFAQDYSEYLEAVRKHLNNGDHKKAEAAYEIYKNLTGKTVAEFENIGASEVVIQKGYVDMGFPSGTKWNSQNEAVTYSFDSALSTFDLSTLPSDKQWQELSDYCNWKWYEYGGLYGYMLTSKFNGNSIFLPADIPYWEFHVRDRRFENDTLAIGLELYSDGAFFRGTCVLRSEQYHVRLVKSR